MILPDKNVKVAPLPTADFFWENRLLDYMKIKNKLMGDDHFLNRAVLDNLLLEYGSLMQKGQKPIRVKNPNLVELSAFVDYTVYQLMKKSLTLPHGIIDSFLRGLITLTRKGVVPMSVYDPLGVGKKEKLLDKGSLLSKLTTGVTGIAVLGALGYGGYYYSKMKKVR